MADFSQIVDHPDSQEIFSKLLSGSSPKDVSQWLKIKYDGKDQTHLRITQKLLKEFVDSQYTDVYQQFQHDLAQVSKSGKDLANSDLPSSLINNKTYMERLQETADKEFNILKTADDLMILMTQRLEQVFDAIQQDPTQFRGDKVLQQYISSFSTLADMIEKFRAIGGGTTNDANTTQQMLQEIVGMFTEVIRETFAEIDPDIAMLLMDNLNKKMSRFKPPSVPTQEDRHNGVQILQERILNQLGDDKDKEE